MRGVIMLWTFLLLVHLLTVSEKTEHKKQCFSQCANKKLAAQEILASIQTKPFCASS